MIYNKIKAIAKSKKISIDSLSEQIGMTRNGFDYMCRENSMKMDTLDKICEVLGVTHSELFSDAKLSTNSGTNIQVNNGSSGLNYNKVSINECVEKVASLQKQIELMEENLRMKDQIIKLLESK